MQRFAVVKGATVVAVVVTDGDPPDGARLAPDEVVSGWTFDGEAFAAPAVQAAAPDPVAALQAVQIAAARRDLPDLLPGMSESERAAAGGLVAAWSGNAVAYGVGDLVRHDGAVFRVVQAHTSQAGWAPPVVPALFAPV